MRHLHEVRKDIRKVKGVTPELMHELEEIYADISQMDFDRADVLFRIKQLYSSNLPPEYKRFFIDKIADFVLDHTEPKGQISKQEGYWLRSRIMKRDEYDRELLDELKERLENIDLDLPSYLKKNSILISKFEDLLYYSRYFAIVSVVGAILSSLILFIQGFGLIIRGLVGFFRDPYERYELLFEQLVSSVDVFLFALVLIIFGVGVYELFIANVDPELKPAESRPTWLKISSVDDLKSSLGKVILMVLIVSFFKHVLEIDSEHWTPISLLYLAIGILLIAGALYLTHKSGTEGEHAHHEEAQAKEPEESFS
ncbi:MAG: YqhA family protein [Muribaculaceae bacterium]|nr:YqhA family protein [Muribaculaceae bacterium]